MRYIKIQKDNISINPKVNIHKFSNDECLLNSAGSNTVPQLFVNERHVGGLENIKVTLYNIVSTDPA
jgi:glutaredoxin